MTKLSKRRMDVATTEDEEFKLLVSILSSLLFL